MPLIVENGGVESCTFSEVGQSKNRIIDGDDSIVVEITCCETTGSGTIFLEEIDQTLKITPVQVSTGIDVPSYEGHGHHCGFRVGGCRRVLQT